MVRDASLVPPPARSTAPSSAKPKRLLSADAAALAVLTGLVSLAAWNRFVFDGWLARFDLYTFFVPWYAFLGERLRAFAIPGWNPHLFSGTPFAGDPESGWWYLPAMLAFALFPVLTGFKVMAALQLAVAALSTFAFARTLGMGSFASLVASVAYVAGPFLHWNTDCCLVIAEAATWIPLALLGIELALRARDWRGRLVPWCMAGLAVSQMFGGWVGEGWLVCPLVVGGYVAYRGILSPPGEGLALRDRLARAIATGAAAIGSGVALGAAGILPRLDVNAQSNLAGADYTVRGAEGILNPPWRPGELLLNVLGSGYDQRRAALGGAVVVLALLAPFVARRRFAVPFFATVTLVAMILTLDTTPLHRLFYLVPGFQVLHEHDPWRTYGVATLGPALLAGAAIEALPRWRGRASLLPLVAVPFALMALIARLMPESEGVVGWTSLLAAAATTALVAAFVGFAPSGVSGSRLARLPRWLPVALLLLVFAQPTGIEMTGSWRGWPPQPSWQGRWHPDPREAASLAAEVSPTAPGGAGAFLQAKLAGGEPFRYVGYGGVAYPGDRARQGSYMGRRFDPAVRAILVNGRPMFLDLFEIQGYDPIELARYADFMTAVNGAPQNYHLAYLMPSGTGSPLLDLLDVRYVLVDATLPPDRPDVAALVAGRREVFRTSAVAVYERDPAPPHAWIVHDVRSVARGEALPLLSAGAIDPYRTALVEGPLPEVAPPAGTDTARVTRYEPDALTVATESTAPGLLVLSEMYERGWTAAVDGAPASILPTDHALRGVPLPAGTHTVELRYEPRSLRLGLLVSGLALLVMVAACALAAWPRVAGRGRLARGRST